MNKPLNIVDEIEIKLALRSFTDYLKLIGFVGQIDSEEFHTNIFYDTPDRAISKAGWALRLRSDNQKGLVTLKSISTREGIISIRQELESEIKRSVVTEITNNTISLLDLSIEPIEFIKSKIKGGKNLEQVVAFENLRQIKAFRIGDYLYDLEIDKTTFHDGTSDYELEVELINTTLLETVEDTLRKIFASLQIDFIHQDKSKFERALLKAGLL